MDFPKFMAMLESSSLFFSKASKLAKLEGEYSKVQKSEKLDLQGNQDTEKSKLDSNLQENGTEIQKETVFINCWHLNHYEQDLLWGYYAGKNCIAIQSTFGKAIKSFEQSPIEIIGGSVSYIDFDSKTLEESHPLFPFVYKPVFFSNEHEVRFITFTKFSEYELFRKYEKVFGRNVIVDLNELIETIYLSPESSSWLHELVESICNRYELNKKIILSKLYK